jgi:hypothetical protein
MTEGQEGDPFPRQRVETLEELWALIKFRLVAHGEVPAIEAEIERMVEAWTKHIDSSPTSAEDFRSRLYNLVREALKEDEEAMARRKQ